MPEENYTYDEMGNREGPTYVMDNINDTDQLLYDGRYRYSYDDNGNMIRKEEDTNGGNGSNGSVTRYEYDDLDRLSWVVNYENAGKESLGLPKWAEYFRYDWAGRVVERQFAYMNNRKAVKKERYVYDGDNIVLMADENGEVVARFHHAAGTIDRPVYMETQGQKYYYHYDERGSVIYLTNSQGQIVQRFWYDAFGRLTLDVGLLLPGRLVHTYTGRMWDPYAEVYNYRARVYDPKTGRFQQHDPVFSANPYAYVGNDPINRTDPYGLRFECGDDPSDVCDDDEGEKGDPPKPEAGKDDDEASNDKSSYVRNNSYGYPTYVGYTSMDPAGSSGGEKTNKPIEKKTDEIVEAVELSWVSMLTGEASREARRRLYKGADNLHSKLESLSEKHLYQFKKEEDLVDKAKPGLKYLVTKGFANLTEELPTNDYDLFLFGLQFEGEGGGKFPKDPMKFLENVERKNIKQGYRWKPSDKIEIEYHNGPHKTEPNKTPHYHVRTEKIDPKTGKKNKVRTKNPNSEDTTFYPDDPFPQ